MFTEDGDSRMGGDEAEEEPIFYEPIFDELDDDLGKTILDAKINCKSEKERLKLEKMLEDHSKLLYPNVRGPLEPVLMALFLLVTSLVPLEPSSPRIPKFKGRLAPPLSSPAVAGGE
jgi:hypothetical protein